MAQIKQIMETNDIAGVIILHTPSTAQVENPEHSHGFAEHLTHLTPTYSAISFAANQKPVIKNKLEHYNGNKLKRDRTVSNTVNMLNMLTEVTIQQAEKLSIMTAIANKAFDAVSFDSSSSSETEQNN